MDVFKRAGAALEKYIRAYPDKVKKDLAEMRRKTKEKYCSCGKDDNSLFITGYCQYCDKPDGNWYP